AGCPTCREMFLSERRLKAKLSRSCYEKAPTGLRARLMVEIRRTTVTTTDADGNSATHRTTTVVHREHGGSRACCTTSGAGSRWARAPDVRVDGATVTQLFGRLPWCAFFLRRSRLLRPRLLIGASFRLWRHSPTATAVWLH